MKKKKRVFIWPLVFLIKIYQKLFSPDNSFWGRSLGLKVCRFRPTCSNYALQALEKYGFFKGIWLSIKRFLRCHPWNAGGDDPVK